MTHPRPNDDPLADDEPERKKACVSIDSGFSPSQQLLEAHNVEIAKKCKEFDIDVDDFNNSSASFVLEITLDVCGRNVTSRAIHSFLKSNKSTNILEVCKQAVVEGDFLKLMQISTSSSPLEEYVLT